MTRTVQAWFLCAGGCFIFTMFSNPAFTTFASIAAVERVLDATASVATRRFSAITDLNIAVGSGKTRLANTCVRALACVQAGATILTGPSIRTVVQILIAK